VVGQKLGVINDRHAVTPHCVALVLNREQGDGCAIKAQQVVLAKLHEGLVGSPLQRVIEVVACSHGEPSCDVRVRGVSQNIDVDLAASTPKLTVWAATVRGGPCVAKMVQHVTEQGQKTGMVQPVATKPSIGSESGVGIVIHLLKTREKRINISPIEQRQ
jgi:hypothetical protein